MELTKLVGLLLLMPLAVGCARSVRPAYPEDLAPRRGHASDGQVLPPG